MSRAGIPNRDVSLRAATLTGKIEFHLGLASKHETQLNDLRRRYRLEGTYSIPAGAEVFKPREKTKPVQPRGFRVRNDDRDGRIYEERIKTHASYESLSKKYGFATHEAARQAIVRYEKRYGLSGNSAIGRKNQELALAKALKTRYGEEVSQRFVARQKIRAAAGRGVGFDDHDAEKIIASRNSGKSWLDLAQGSYSRQVTLQERTYRYLASNGMLFPEVVAALWNNTRYQWLANKVGAPSITGRPIKR